jgi:hypothetical protein
MVVRMLHLGRLEVWLQHVVVPLLGREVAGLQVDAELFEGLSNRIAALRRGRLLQSCEIRLRAGEVASLQVLAELLKTDGCADGDTT